MIKRQIHTGRPGHPQVDEESVAYHVMEYISSNCDLIPVLENVNSICKCNSTCRQEGKLRQHRGFLQPTKARGARMSGYTQLTQVERYQINILKKAEYS